VLADPRSNDADACRYRHVDSDGHENSSSDSNLDGHEHQNSTSDEASPVYRHASIDGAAYRYDRNS
jgi:hypothetical protein